MFFKKAQEIERPQPESTNNEQVQGSYTDHHMHPLKIRNQLSPLHGEELEAYEWVIRQMEKEEPDAKYMDLVDMGFDYGWFVLGKQGELRVSKEVPS